MSGDFVLKHHLINMESLHLMLDLVVGDIENPSPQYASIIINALIKLMETSKNSIYIPGETLENQKQRVKIMQHGLLVAFLHAYERTKQDDIKKIIEGHLKRFYEIQELEWNYKLINKLIERNRLQIADLQHLNRNTGKGFDSLPSIKRVLEQNANIPECSNKFLNLLSGKTESAMRQRGPYLDLWQGKDLLLSEYSSLKTFVEIAKN